jgi:hypothetical protein
MAAIELVTSTTAFWHATGAVFRAANPRTSDTKDNRMKEALIRLPYARVTWVCAVFLLGYVGIEVALGGWIVKFMLEVRDGEEFASGMTATGFWMGITVGRIVLGFVTPRLGEKLAIIVSCANCHESLCDFKTQRANDMSRSTSYLRWHSNSSSGSYRNSTYRLSPYLSKASSSARFFPLRLWLRRSSCHAIYTSVLLGLLQRLEAQGLLFSHSLSVQSRRRRAYRSCNRLSWHSWV